MIYYSDKFVMYAIADIFTFIICLVIGLIWRFIFPRRRLSVWFIYWPILLLLVQCGLVGGILACVIGAFLNKIKYTKFFSPYIDSNKVSKIKKCQSSQ